MSHLIRRGVLGAGTHTYLSVLSTTFKIDVNSPFVFVLPTVTTLEYDIFVKPSANNNLMTIIGKGGSSVSSNFENIIGSDPDFTTPVTNGTNTTVTATGFGDLRGKREKHIEVTHGTGGLMTVRIDGVVEGSISGAAQTGTTLSLLFSRDNITSAHFNPDILIRNLKVSTSGGTTINMPLNGNFANTGSSALGTITGVEGVDYEFVEA
ncbi:MAG: hypothetical protein MJK15_03995 [Colwellia sp.]|nr:hypothetical protein [Colwellia sp.]